MSVTAQLKIMRWPELRDSLVEAGGEIAGLQRDLQLAALSAIGAEAARVAGLRRLWLALGASGEQPAKFQWVCDEVELQRAALERARAVLARIAALSARDVTTPLVGEIHAAAVTWTTDGAP